MLIITQGKNFISKMYIPKQSAETVWIKGKKNEKIARVQFKNNSWYILKDKNLDIINIETNKLSEEFEIHIYDNYLLTNNISKQKYIVYCSETNESSLIHLSIKEDKITIGKDPRCSICYDNKLMSDNHATLYLSEKKWIIENHDKKIGIVLNYNKNISKQRKLENGDCIFIAGLKLIVIGNNIFINNPNRKVKCDGKRLELFKDIKKVEEERLNDNKIENKSGYYYRVPRIIHNFDNDELQFLEPPPKMDYNNKMPFILTLGSTISMGVVSILTCTNTIINLSKAEISILQKITEFLMSFLMIISMLVIPLLTARWERNIIKKNEKERQKKYRDYINSKEKKLILLKNKKKQYLEKSYPTVSECIEIIENKTDRLWERKIQDYDFLTINLGNGNDVFQKMEKESYGFKMQQDDLIELLYNLKDKAKTIENVPITISLRKERVLGLIEDNNEEIEKILQEILVQLIAFHSYDDLKLVFLLNKDRIQDWTHIKMLPYIWDKYNSFRFLGTNYSDNMEDISNYLEREFNIRKASSDKQTEFRPYYLIITDDYKNIKDLNITSKIVKEHDDLGFGMLCIGNTIRELPEECKTFIKIKGNKGQIIKSQASAEEQKEFVMDNNVEIPFDDIVQTVGNIPIKEILEEQNLFPEEYSFLDMFNVSSVEELDIKNRWKNNDAITSLAAPIGISESGKIIKLDIHEKAHGPHGLIAGSTGSRKI